MEDSENPNMLRSEGAPSPKGAVVLAKQALPLGRKRLDMSNSAEAVDSLKKAAGKIDIIFDHLSEDYDDVITRRYGNAVAAYVTLGADSFDSRRKNLELIWNKTKQIIDRTRNERYQGDWPRDFLNSIQSLPQEIIDDNNDEKRYISEVVSVSDFDRDTINLIFSPCGSGKTTFIETTLKDYAQKANRDLLYLAPTCALRDAVNSRGEEYIDVCPDGREIRRLKQKGITAMTYAKFGSMIAKAKEQDTYDASKFWGSNSVICLDEMHQAVNQLHYSKNDNNITQIALDELIERSKDKSNLIVAFSATPQSAINFMFSRFDGKNLRLRLTRPALHLKSYVAKTEIKYRNLPQLIEELDPTQRGLIYIDRISQIEKTMPMLESRGIHAVGIWSPRSKKRMIDEQWRAVESIVRDEAVPNDIQVLIINAAYQTGLNIDPNKTRLDYIVVHNSNEDTQTQAKGRYRGDIDVVYTREKSSECEYVIAQEAIAPYLEIRLYTEDKKELCEKLDLRDDRGRQLGWRKIKSILRDEGYEIYDTHTGNVRYSVISI